MSTKKHNKTTGKLELHAETLVKLDDLSTVQGGILDGDIVITRKGGDAKGSWVLCCQAK